MSVIEAVTVVRYRVKDPPKGWRRRRLRASARVAYRDAAWAKIRERCECDFPLTDTDPPVSLCRYHDREYRAAGGGPDYPPEFTPPRIWGLPRSDRWDYGRAVAFRLARLYVYLDARAPGGDQGGGNQP